MKNLFLLLGVFTFLFSCGSKKTGISDFTWIEGKWNGSTDGTEFFEDWKPLTGTRLEGKGGAYVGKDTLFSEKIQIEQRGEDIFYIATLSENGSPVDFKFTGYRDDSVIFENPAHDFPQRVVYFRNPGNRLYACIDGKENGKYKRIEFSFARSK